MVYRRCRYDTSLWKVLAPMTTEANMFALADGSNSKRGQGRWGRWYGHHSPTSRCHMHQLRRQLDAFARLAASPQQALLNNILSISQGRRGWYMKFSVVITSFALKGSTHPSPKIVKSPRQLGNTLRQRLWTDGTIFSHQDCKYPYGAHAESMHT